MTLLDTKQTGRQRSDTLKLEREGLLYPVKKNPKNEREMKVFSSKGKENILLTTRTHTHKKFFRKKENNRG